MNHQEDFFDALANDPLYAENAPDFDFELELQVIIEKRRRSLGMSREQLVDKLNLTLRSAEKEVTLNQWKKWIAKSQANTIPAWLIPSICWALNFADPLAMYANALGRSLSDRKDQILKEQAELDVEFLALKQRKKKQERLFQEIIKHGYTG